MYKLSIPPPSPLCLRNTWTLPKNSGSISGHLNATPEISHIWDSKGLQPNESEIYVNEYQTIGIHLQLLLRC